MEFTNSFIRRNILASFKLDDDVAILLNKAEQDDIQKGKIAATIGTRKEFGGRPYIKTAEGWKYYGSGGGEKASEHAGKSVPVGVGSTIKNKKGVHGTVIGKDDKHTHIEYKDADGKDAVSKVPHEHLQEKLDSGEFEHAVPAKSAAKMRDEAESGSKKEGSEPKEGEAKSPKVTSAALKDAEKVATDEDIDINERFEAFELFTHAVIKGRMKSMIAYGTGGVGKTYTVMQQLKKAGKIEYNEDKMSPGSEDYDYVKVTGKSTPTAVWKELYQHNGKIIMFDDNDAVLKNPDAVNFFKGALDTSGDNTISYGTTKKLVDDDGNELPKRFKFTGRCIFVSNLPPNEIPQPLKSRGFSVDLSMNKDQTMTRLRSIAKNKEGKLSNLKFPGIEDYSEEDMKEVLDHVDSLKDKMHADLSVRTIGALLGIKKDAEEMGKDWKKMASHQLFSKSESMNNMYDGSEILKSRRDQILKSYGLDSSKREIKKSEEVTSQDHIGGLEKSEETEQIEKAEPTELEKAFNELNAE